VGLKRADWKVQCTLHAAAAKDLLAKGRFSTAYYLAGLAVECALKAKIARAFKASTWPTKKFVNDVYCHDLEALVNQAGLSPQLKHQQTIGSFGTLWKTVRTWKNDSRYTVWSDAEARDMVRAALGRSGVLSWIKKHW
jgi:hypothetical protein